MKREGMRGRMCSGKYLRYEVLCVCVFDTCVACVCCICVRVFECVLRVVCVYMCVCVID